MSQVCLFPFYTRAHTLKIRKKNCTGLVADVISSKKISLNQVEKTLFLKIVYC
jgi:hypothetical protein